MKISARKKYAVLTGDIVGSSKLPKGPRQSLPDLLRRASRLTRKAFPEAVPLEVDVFRGDGWQLLVDDPVKCLRIALFFRACVRSGHERGRGLDTRIAIGLSGVDFVPGQRVSEGDGEAYRLSGRALESLARKSFLTLVTSETDTLADVRVVTHLLDALAQDWTGKQARAVAGALQGWTQQKIADAWAEKTRQPVIARHLDHARWGALEEGLAFVEAALVSFCRDKVSSGHNAEL
jgi:hypothetical protein